MLVARFILVVVAFLLFGGCTPVEYKKADLSFYGGREGYLDKEIAPGVFVVEVAQIGGYQFTADYEGTLSVLKEHWERRAAELCPAGYEGGHKVILPPYAKIEEFYCPERFCMEYPMVSGIIRCKKPTEI